MGHKHNLLWDAEMQHMNKFVLRALATSTSSSSRLKQHAIITGFLLSSASQEHSTPRNSFLQHLVTTSSSSSRLCLKQQQQHNTRSESLHVLDCGMDAISAERLWEPETTHALSRVIRALPS